MLGKHATCTTSCLQEGRLRKNHETSWNGKTMLQFIWKYFETVVDVCRLAWSCICARPSCPQGWVLSVSDRRPSKQQSRRICQQVQLNAPRISTVEEMVGERDGLEVEGNESSQIKSKKNIKRIHSAAKPRRRLCKNNWSWHMIALVDEICTV